MIIFSGFGIKAFRSCTYCQEFVEQLLCYRLSAQLCGGAWYWAAIEISEWFQQQRMGVGTEYVRVTGGHEEAREGSLEAVLPELLLEVLREDSFMKTGAT